MKKLNKKITGYIAMLMAVALCIGILPVQNANASEGASAQDTEIFADVESELTLDKEEVALSEEDGFEDEEWGMLYAERVHFTLTVQGKVDTVYSHAYLRFDYQTVFMAYDSSNSTENTTVYEGFVVIDQYHWGDKDCDFVIDEIYLERSDNGQREKVQFAPKTLKVTRNFADKEVPQLESVSIDKQGETINTGQVVISIKASDNARIDEVSVELATTLEGVGVRTYEEYRTQEDGTYKVVINVTAEGIPQSKWYIQEINLYDLVRNKNTIEYGQDSPYYFYIDQTGGTGNTPEQPGNTPEQPGNTPEQPGNTPGQSGNTTTTPGNTQGEATQENTTAGDKTTETNAKPVIKPAASTNTPETGDNNSVMIYVAIGLIAVYALVVAKKRKTFVK